MGMKGRGVLCRLADEKVGSRVGCGRKVEDKKGKRGKSV